MLYILLFILLLSCLVTFIRIRNIFLMQKEFNAELQFFPEKLKYNYKKGYIYNNFLDNQNGYMPILDDYSKFFGNNVNFLHIKFTYNSNTFIILFKKGMFGCFTGAYIKLFSKNKINNNLLTTYKEEEPNILFKNIKFNLCKNKTKILKCNLKNNCNGYKIYEYLPPEKLLLKAVFNCKNRDIKNAFLMSLDKEGIKHKKIFNKIFVYFKTNENYNKNYTNNVDNNEELSKYYILKFSTYNKKDTYDKLMYLKKYNNKFYNEILANIVKNFNRIS